MVPRGCLDDAARVTSSQGLGPSRATVAALVLALVAAAAVVVSRHSAASPTVDSASASAAGDSARDTRTGSDLVLPVGPAAPAVQADQWLNTAPLTTADLAGKVVLYDFWTFGCVNCRHTQPYVKAWHARYARDGLVVLSVHTPEFGYEADAGNVRDYVRENGITYPVALDPDHRIWDAFDNHYWPQFYLHDRDGHRRLVRIGEGSYDSTEDAIRTLLGVPATAPRAATG